MGWRIILHIGLLSAVVVAAYAKGYFEHHPLDLLCTISIEYITILFLLLFSFVDM